MDSKLIDSVCQQVYRKFPEVDGAKPTVSARPNAEYLLVFKGSAVTADGHTLPRTVRVVADAKGKVVRMTTSR